MKITVVKKVEYEFQTIKVDIPFDNDDLELFEERKVWSKFIVDKKDLDLEIYPELYRTWISETDRLVFFIDVEKGVIIDWPGKKGYLFSKVRDSGIYTFINKKPIGTREIAFKIELDYIPNSIFPPEDGYGDYIELDVNENGEIKNWNPSFNEVFKNDIID